MSTEAEEAVVEEETTAVEETEESQEINPLDMDDEAFDALLANGFNDEVEEESVDTQEETETEEESTEETVEEETTETEETVTEETEESSEEEVKKELTAEDQLKEIFAPFKANGHEMSVDNIDDIRTLMQMGANYNKKMASLKPNLKILKMLENNNLLDESKLNFLIDLDKKNPEAVKKLIQDSKIDLDEVDIEEKSSYKPNTYTVNDKEVELDETLNSIKDTKSYAQTLDIISNKWDESSKQMLLENPAGIAVLNQHLELGVYSKIAAAVETERALNRLPIGMSDLEAYKYVAEQINARGGFAKTTSTSRAETTLSKATKSVVDPKLNNLKKAASSTKSLGKTTKQKIDFNPLAMSDEEFAKVGIEKFI